MTDLGGRPGHQEALDKAPGGENWRRVLMALGGFCFIAALFIGAAMKGGAGGVPKFLALAGIGLMVVSGIASLIHRVSGKGSRGAQTPA